MLLLIALLYLGWIFLIFFFEGRSSRKKDVFSPVYVFVYFSLLSVTPLLWLSTDPLLIKKYIFGLLSNEYHDFEYVHLAFWFTILGSICAFVGIQIGLRAKIKSILKILSSLININQEFVAYRHAVKYKKSKQKYFWFGVFVFFLGLIVYSYFIYRAGGLASIWLSLNTRVEQTAGLAYFQRFYTFSIMLGSILCFYASSTKAHFYFSCVFGLAGLAILGSLGQRSPVFMLFYSLIVCLHYTKKQIDFKKFFDIKKVTFVCILIILSIIAVQFRSPGAAEKYFKDPEYLINDSIETFEKHTVLRLGRLERDIVILKYFDFNDFWFGLSYQSLIISVVPRQFYSDKPPLDTGRYLTAMSIGQRVKPPMGLSKLPATSLPEGNWIGYMNFYIPGFIIAFFCSGFLLSFFYRFAQYNNFSIMPVFIYSLFSWNGGLTLTPGDISVLLTTLLFTFFYASLMSFCRINRVR